jgi:hypothetical protein
MIAALAVLAVAVIGGTAATYWYDPDAPGASRPFIGAATGLVALALVGLATGFVLGPVAASVLPAALTVGTPIGLLAIPRYRDAARGDLAGMVATVRRGAAAWPRTLLLLAGLGALIAVGLLAVDRVMIEGPGGIGTGYVNNLGDLPFHLQVVASFGWAGNLPPKDPTYAGAAFTYPFLADYLSGMLVMVGASLRAALLLPTLVLATALVGVLVRFGAAITRDRIAGWLTPLLVLLGGGVGWVMLVDDVLKGSAGPLQALFAPTHDYTLLPDTVWRWGNAITTLLVTQRSLLLGLPLTVVALTLFWSSLAPATTSEERRLRSTRLGVAGLATGALVLAHTHSFVVLLGTAFLLGILFAEWRDGRWRAWVLFLAATAVIAAPSALLLVADSSASAGTFFGLAIGWDRGDTDPVTFWLLNTGLFLPLLAGALLAGRVPWGGGHPLVDGRLLRFWLPFIAWFVVPNVVKLAPWTWDNIKVLIYWWVGSAPLVALAIVALWRGRWRSIPLAAARAAAAGALVVLTLAGSLDVWRVVSGLTSYEQFDAPAVAFAERIKAAVPTDALVLHAPTWNPPVYLTGRPSLLGYPGWIWAHGLPYVDRERDIGLMYGGGPDALSLMHRYGIQFVEITPLERSSLEISDDLFADFPVVAEVGDYRLYRVPR